MLNETLRDPTESLLGGGSSVGEDRVPCFFCFREYLGLVGEEFTIRIL
jgi:hypothetical protein